nr:MAG TPA: hypothetical protein [Caudoviricetes sp.]
MLFPSARFRISSTTVPSTSDSHLVFISAVYSFGLSSSVNPMISAIFIHVPPFFSCIFPFLCL